VVNPGNPFVLDPHLAAAAHELPLTLDDAEYWGDDLEEGVGRLVKEDMAVLRNGRVVYAGRGSPAAKVGLRTGSSAEIRIVVGEEGRLLGLIDESRAFTAVHPGAIYLHQGQHYRVERLDLDDRAAWVVPTDPEELTQARSETNIAILEQDAVAEVGRVTLALGPVEVTEQVTGYRRKSLYSGEVLGDEPLDLPPTTLVTRAFWYTIDEAVLERAGIVRAAWPGTLHAAEHAGIGMLPLFTICDRWDVGGVSTALQADTGVPTIVVYDGYPGGAGIAELGFESGWLLLERTLESVGGCPCASGCPSCVQSPKCGNLNEPLDKHGAIALLAEILSARRVQRPVA
jgi:DEAD/DEAH box helicase domain-containing protein